jgi:hypothetical protein
MYKGEKKETVIVFSLFEVFVKYNACISSQLKALFGVKKTKQ